MRHIFWPTVYINSLRPSWGTRAQHASPGTCWWSWTGLHNTSCYDFCTQRRYQSTTRRTWVTRTRTHHRCTLCTHPPTYSHFSSSVKLLSSLLLMPIVHYIYRKCSTNRNTNTMIYWSENIAQIGNYASSSKYRQHLFSYRRHTSYQALQNIL